MALAESVNNITDRTVENAWSLCNIGAYYVLVIRHGYENDKDII